MNTPLDSRERNRKDSPGKRLLRIFAILMDSVGISEDLDQSSLKENIIFLNSNESKHGLPAD